MIDRLIVSKKYILYYENTMKIREVNKNGKSYWNVVGEI